MLRGWRTRAIDWVVATASADPAPLPRYLATLALCAAAVVLRLVAHRWLGDSAPFALFLPAVLLSAGYGGFGPGLLATGLLTLAGIVMFQTPLLDGTASPAGAIRTFFFALNGLLVSMLADILHHARRRMQRLERERTAQSEQESARLAERRQVRATALAGLDDVLTVSDAADILIAQGLAGLDASAGGLALFDPASGQLVVRRSVGYPADLPRVVPLDVESPAVEALRTRRPVAVGSMAELAERYPQAPAVRARLGGTREALLAAPFVVQERALGVLYLGFGSPRRFAPDELELFRTLAEHGAPALERAMRYEAERTARLEAEASEARHRLLAEVSGLLATSGALDATLPEIARQLVPRLADACTVHVIGPDGGARCAAAVHADDALTPVVAALCEASARGAGSADLARCLRGGEPARLEDVSSWRASAPAGEEAGLLAKLAFAGGLSAPLLARGRALGRLALFTSAGSRPPAPEDLALLAEVAARVAAALDGAQLLAEAQRLNRVKDEFLAMLSHELRTPLGAVLLWTDLLATEPLAGGAARAAEMIGRSTRSLQQLIEELLDVSRIVAGKMTLDPHPTAMKELLQGVVDAARPAAEAKGVSLELSVHGSFPIAWVDSHRLRQVFDNVVMNAVKFTPQGGEIAVSLERVDDRARVRVRDSGVGMRPELLPVIFERFRQGDSSSRRVQGGLGLGLTIAQHIVDLHDGRISAWSEGEGRGSTFTVELPVPPPPPAVLSLLPAQADREQPLKGSRVLVVDDHEDTLRGISVALEGSGAEVCCVGSVREALAALGSFAPHVLVSDIAMPEQDGYDLIRALRARPDALAGIPAVAVSAYASKEDRQRALAAGFQEHLPKPVDISRLVHSLVRLTPAPATPGTAASPRPSPA